MLYACGRRDGLNRQAYDAFISQDSTSVEGETLTHNDGPPCLNLVFEILTYHGNRTHFTSELSKITYTSLPVV